jgi:hypothetical protein
VLQGSTLGPLFFLIYINDLPLNVLDPNIVLFADDTNILISRENLNVVQFKLNIFMQDIETWFASNCLIVNAGKTTAISFHTSQNKKPALPQVLFEDGEIPYCTEIKFLGVHIKENMKWITHINHLSSKLNTGLYMIKSLTNIRSKHVLRTMYFACVHIHLRYGVTLWGGVPKSNKIFRLQKKVIRIRGRLVKHVSCRKIFKDLNILPLPCSYISEIVYRARLNREQMSQNEETHDHDTQQKSDLHTQ